jgi:hypothetical protein
MKFENKRRVSGVRQLRMISVIMAWGERDVRVQLGRVLTYTHVGRARMNHQYLHGLYQPLMQQSSGLFTIALLTIFLLWDGFIYPLGIQYC